MAETDAWLAASLSERMDYAWRDAVLTLAGLLQVVEEVLTEVLASVPAACLFQWPVITQ